MHEFLLFCGGRLRAAKLTVSLANSGDVEEMDGMEKSTLKIFKNITLVHESSMVMLEVSSKSPLEKLPVLCPLLIHRVSLCIPLQWIANPLNDMYADAVTTVVLEVQSNPKAQKGQFVERRRTRSPFAASRPCS